MYYSWSHSIENSLRGNEVFSSMNDQVQLPGWNSLGWSSPRWYPISTTPDNTTLSRTGNSWSTAIFTQTLLSSPPASYDTKHVISSAEGVAYKLTWIQVKPCLSSNESFNSTRATKFLLPSYFRLSPRFSRSREQRVLKPQTPSHQKKTQKPNVEMTNPRIFNCFLSLTFRSQSFSVEYNISRIFYILKL